MLYCVTMATDLTTTVEKTKVILICNSCRHDHTWWKIKTTCNLSCQNIYNVYIGISEERFYLKKQVSFVLLLDSCKSSHMEEIIFHLMRFPDKLKQVYTV